jgi:hypothetical protein
MHGVPVVGARAGGIPEEIDEGRRAGCSTRNDASSLAEVLRERLSDRADRALAPAASPTASPRSTPTASPLSTKRPTPMRAPSPGRRKAQPRRG